MDLTTWLLAGGVVAIATIVQAATGMGFSVVAVPALALAAPTLDTVPVLAATVVVMLIVTWRERRALAWSDLGLLLAGAAPGVVAGTVVARGLAGAATDYLVGGVVVAASTASLLAWRVPMSRRTLVVAGGLGGALTPVAALPGPPVAITYRPPDVHRMRATMSAFFATTSLSSVLTLFVAEGRADAAAFAAEVGAGLTLTPAVVLGILLSLPLVERLPPVLVQKAALWLSLLSGLTLVTAAIRG